MKGVSQMKRVLSVILAVAVLACVALTLVSCGPSGTYEGTLFDLKFSGSSVTVIVGDGDDAKELKGTYEITEEDEKQYISFDFIDEEEAEEDEAYVLGIIDKVLSGKMAYSEEDGTITIGSGLFASKFTKK